MSENKRLVQAAAIALSVGVFLYFGTERLRSQQEIRSVGFERIDANEQAYIVCGKYSGKATESGGNIWVYITKIGKDKRVTQWWGEDLEESSWVQFRFIDTGIPGLVRASETLDVFASRSECIADLKFAESKPSAFGSAYR